MPFPTTPAPAYPSPCPTVHIVTRYWPAVPYMRPFATLELAEMVACAYDVVRLPERASIIFIALSLPIPWTSISSSSVHVNSIGTPLKWS
jgi:hypothetical protein